MVVTPACCIKAWERLHPVEILSSKLRYGLRHNLTQPEGLLAVVVLLCGAWDQI